MGPADTFESDSEDEDESLTVPKPSEDDLVSFYSSLIFGLQLIGYQDDPIIEYEDEFGRVRTARRSEVPRHLAPGAEPEHDDDE